MKNPNKTMKKKKVKDLNPEGRLLCKDCGASFASQATLYTHRAKFHRPNDFKCEPCNMFFETGDLLQKHKEIIHGPNHFKCLVCKKGFSTAKNLYTHRTVHMDRKLNEATCPICQIVLKHRRHMPTHIKTVHGEKVKCDFCDYSTSHPKLMKSHVLAKHSGTPASTGGKPTPEEGAENEKKSTKKIPGSFACSMCEAVLSYKAGLKRHLERIHNIKDTAKIEEICELADQLYKESKGVYKKVTPKPAGHFCGPCDKYFPTEAALNEHFISFHPPVKPVCPHCGKIYNDDNCLTLHIKYSHGQKEYSCSQCDYKTTNSLCFKHHIKAHHTKSIPCDICGAVFPNRMQIIKHKSAMHKTRRVCELCGSSWKDNYNLRRHMLRKHKIVVYPDPPKVKTKAPPKVRAKRELEAPIHPPIPDDNDDDSDNGAWSEMPQRDDSPVPLPSPETVAPTPSPNETAGKRMAMVTTPQEDNPRSRAQNIVKEEIVEEEIVFDATPFVVTEIGRTEIKSAPVSERDPSPMFSYSSGSDDEEMPNYESEEEQEEDVVDDKLDLNDPPTLEFLELFTYRCHYCRVTANKSLRFDNYKKMLAHFRREHSTNGYAFCGTKKFSTEFIAAAYENLLITTKDPKKCPECKNTFAKDGSLADHLRKKHKLMYRPESETLIASYDKHFKYHCEECLDGEGRPTTLQDFETMSKHFGAVHQLPGYVFCCDGKKIPRHLCKVHVDFHLVAKQIRCPDCRLYVSTEAVLRDHQETCKTLKEDCRKRKTKTTDGDEDAKKKSKPETVAPEKYDEFFKYQCDACPDEELTTFMQMSNHFRKVHKSKGYAFCCGKKIGRYSIPSHYLLHTDSSQLTCPECNFVATALSSFQRHMRVIHNQVAEPEGPELLREFDRLFEYRCEECPSMVENEMSSFVEMRDHFEKTHQSTGYVFCCGQKITRGFCEPHLEYHRRPDKLSCAHCAAFFHTATSLRRHVKNKVCKKSLAGVKRFDSTAPITDMYDKFFTYQCVDCVDSEGVMKKFANYKAMRSHLKYAGHASKTMYAYCCGEQIVPAQFSDHLRKHLSPASMTCLECNRQFSRKVLLDKHIRIVHLNIKPPKTPFVETKRCGLCDIRFETHAEFLKHRKDVHEPSMSCDQCGKVLANKKNLRQHIREVHPSSETKAEDLVCPECGKMMKTTEALRLHRRNSHLKPDLNCPYCSYTTKFKNCMNLHLAKHVT